MPNVVWSSVANMTVTLCKNHPIATAAISTNYSAYLLAFTSESPEMNTSVYEEARLSNNSI